MNPDRTCRVYWLDQAGQSTKAGLPPCAGRWWVDRTTLCVNANLQPGFGQPGWWNFQGRRQKFKQEAWRLAIRDDALLFAADSQSAIPMHRRPALIRDDEQPGK